MPYETISDLPPAVRRLPPHAQEIFLSAFNSAWDSYGKEATAFRVAWAAVKKRYRKEGDDWVEKTDWRVFGG
jgi:cation transport regulator